ncbi:MAG: SusC/RagA family TonB-linked outer membrane protein, partial [Bacteroidales bacterium]|nr:SusC/RagA family TonB-linked outer membrane protein [Bacteroidales bacterium]
MKERPSPRSISGYSVCVKSCRLLLMMLALFTMLMQPLSAQGNNQITGTVSDASGAPMPGVNVVLKGTTTGTITGTDGSYSLRVANSQAVLQFSFIGYLGQEVRVGNQGTINVILAEDTQALEEVVVIGYGTVKKSDLTGSVASVNTEELMKRRPISLEQGMQGMAAGVQVIRNSGQPGGESTIRIRGTATINNSAEPLYVIDGIMVGSSASFLNPNDVESIEILKDASATAIYGSRGANGVIMITTKKGSKGRISLNFDASFGLQTPGKKIEVANAAQFAAAANQVSANDNTSYNPVWANPSSLHSIDWQDEMSRNSLMQQYNLSASGGSENTQAMMSVGYTNNEGIIRASNYNRITARANITHNIKDFIRTGLNISYMHSESEGGGNLFTYAALVPTMDTLSDGNVLHVPVQYANGTYGHYPREGNGFNNKGADNPVAQADLADAVNMSDRTLVNA